MLAPAWAVVKRDAHLAQLDRKAAQPVSFVLALAAKKQPAPLPTVEAPGFDFVVEVPGKKGMDAREFAARINNAGEPRLSALATHPTQPERMLDRPARSVRAQAARLRFRLPLGRVTRHGPSARLRR
jgi:hypothetical protein